MHAYARVCGLSRGAGARGERCRAWLALHWQRRGAKAGARSIDGISAPRPFCGMRACRPGRYQPPPPVASTAWRGVAGQGERARACVCRRPAALHWLCRHRCPCSPAHMRPSAVSAAWLGWIWMDIDGYRWMDGTRMGFCSGRLTCVTPSGSSCSSETSSTMPDSEKPKFIVACAHAFRCCVAMWPARGESDGQLIHLQRAGGGILERERRGGVAGHSAVEAWQLPPADKAR